MPTFVLSNILYNIVSCIENVSNSEFNIFVLFSKGQLVSTLQKFQHTPRIKLETNYS